MNSIHEEGINTEGVKSNTSESGIKGKGMLALKGRGKAKFVQASGEGVQATLNQLYKKGDKMYLWWYCDIQVSRAKVSQYQYMNWNKIRIP